MKKILSFILILLLVIGLMPVSAAAEDHYYAQMIAGTYSDLYLQHYMDMDSVNVVQGSLPEGVWVIAYDSYLNVYGTPGSAGIYDVIVEGKDVGDHTVCTAHVTVTVYEYEEWSCVGLDAGAGGAVQYSVGDTFDLSDCHIFSYWENQLGETKVVQIGENELYTEGKVRFDSEGFYDVDVYCDLPEYEWDDHYWTYNGVTQFHTSVGCYASKTADPPVIKTKELPDGIVGVPYEQKIEATGEDLEFDVYYNPGHRNEFEDTGLTLSKSGTISGTPKEAGSFRFTVMVGSAGGEEYVTYDLFISDVDTFNQYNLTVGGIAVNDINRDDILGDGRCSYDPGTNILTLDNALIQNYVTAGPTDYYIICDSSLTVELKGTNRIVMKDSGMGIQAAAYLDLIGDGELVITGEALYGDMCGLIANADITVNGPSVDITITGNNEKYDVAALAAEGDLVFKAGSLSMYGEDAAMFIGGILDLGGRKIVVCEGDEKPGTQVETLSGGENYTFSAKYVSVGVGKSAGKTGRSFIDTLKENPLYLAVGGLGILVVILLVLLLKKKK